MNKQELLHKYLNDECSPEELRLLYNYLLKDDGEEYQNVLYQIWRELDLNPVQSLDEATFEKIYDKIVSKVKNDIENK